VRTERKCKNDSQYEYTLGKKIGVKKRSGADFVYILERYICSIMNLCMCALQDSRR